MTGRNLTELPDDLPVPTDDGACDHLIGAELPPIALRATDGTEVDLSQRTGRSVVYAYPRTGLPDRDLPSGWNEIPGARGCTPQSCGFRDVNSEFTQRGVRVFGLSVQDTVYQREAVERLHLPFPLLSDVDGVLTDALSLPTFEFGGERLLKRATFVILDGRFEHVFYPVFPPSTNAIDVLAWLDR